MFCIIDVACHSAETLAEIFAHGIRFALAMYFDNSFANGRTPLHDLVCPLTRFPLMHRSCGSSTVFWHSPMRNVDHYNMPPSPFCSAIYLRHPSTPLRIVATLAADRIIVVFHRGRGEPGRGRKWNPPEVDEVVQSRKIVCAADRKRTVRGYKLNRGVSHPTRKSEFARPLNRQCATVSPVSLLSLYCGARQPLRNGRCQ